MLLRFLIILAYFSIELASAEQSTRERIAKHKKWLEQREARKNQLTQLKMAGNLTDDQYWSSYYRYYKHDLNKTQSNATKSRRKPLLGFRLKSKRKKQQQHLQWQSEQQNKQIQTNSVYPDDSSIDMTTSTMATAMPTTSAAKTLSEMPFVTGETTTTAGITKSTDELQPNARDNYTTSKINTNIESSDDWISSSSTSTSRINELLASTPMTTTTTIPTTTPTTTTTIAPIATIKTTTTENSITYNVTVDKFNRAQTIHKVKSRRLSNAAWGRWQKWTKCSRSCGGGVMSQSRHCLSRDTTLKNRTSNECIGLQKRYRICNEQSCPEHELDFRDQQCIYYNNQTFHGKTYSWESYVVDEAECELNCKPVGMNYFATLNDRVIDGTSCLFPVDFVRQNHSGRAMCVDGICKAIHNSGILTGAFLNSGAVRCGSTVCNQISKVFTENPLPIGYNHIDTIPAGASNISILELKNSESYLVLKRSDEYIINGDNTISDSGVYRAAGSVWDYRRIDDAIESSDEKTEGVTEWITATGPIREAVYLMLLSQGRNPGIKYEYLLPVNPETLPKIDENGRSSVEMEADMPPDSESNAKSIDTNQTGEKRKKKSSYVWKVVSFSSCSKTCGGGTLSPIIRCVREGTNKFFNHKRCAHQSKPVLNDSVLRCNVQPCPAYWKVDEWTACNCGLPNENDFQTRNMKCVQDLTSGVVIQVNDGACLEQQPDKRQACACPKQPVAYYRTAHRGKDKAHHSNHNRHHHHNAPITLIGNSTIGRRAHHLEGRKPGVWLSSDWNEQCSTKCGEGTQYRSIFCDRSMPKSDRCDVHLTPDTTRSCTEAARCNVGDWFIGPWSECFGDCFNLMRSRSVLCIKDDQIVGDSLCLDSNNVDSTTSKPTTKPITMEKCELKDVPYCKPKWHYSEWSECTRNCGGGTQRRTVKCFEPDIKDALLKESERCRYSERPQGFKSCNAQACKDDESSEQEATEEAPRPVVVPTKKHAEPKVKLIQNDSIPKCEDRYRNCQAVVKARLCTYDYYIENCCFACKEAIEIGY